MTLSFFLSFRQIEVILKISQGAHVSTHLPYLYDANKCGLHHKNSFGEK